MNKICPFENYLFLRFKKSVLKSTLLLLFFISFSVAQAQSAPIDSVELARRTAFQDSIFKGLLKPQPYKTSSKKNKEKDAERNNSSNHRRKIYVPIMSLAPSFQP